MNALTRSLARLLANTRNARLLCVSVCGQPQACFPFDHFSKDVVIDGCRAAEAVSAVGGLRRPHSTDIEALVSRAARSPTPSPTGEPAAAFTATLAPSVATQHPAAATTVKIDRYISYYGTRAFTSQTLS